MNTEYEKKLSIYWDEKLTPIQKQNFIKKNHFWEGLSTFKYKYIPEDVQKKLLLKMLKN